MNEFEDKRLKGRVINIKRLKYGIYADLDLGENTCHIVYDKQQKNLPAKGDIIQVDAKNLVPTENVPTLYTDNIQILNRCNNPNKLNAKIKELLIIRRKIEYIIEKNLEEAGALRVSTNILGKYRGTSKIDPFETKDKKGKDYFLRFTHGMALKKIVCDTQLPVYEIGKVFRNMGQSPKYIREYNMAESQFPFKSLDYAINLSKNIMSEIAQYFGCEGFHELPVFTVAELFSKAGYDINKLTDEDKKTIFKTQIKKQDGPFYSINPPAEWSPLTVKNEDNTARDAEFIYNKVGLVHICEEEYDYNALNSSMVKQAVENKHIDKDFLDKMQAGMPPTVGLALGPDRIISAFQKKAIQEVIPYER